MDVVPKSTLLEIWAIDDDLVVSRTRHVVKELKELRYGASVI